MTRVQFLNELYRRLGGLSREAAEQHLTYYAEMLADRMEEGMSEEEAVASMENVDAIAARIRQEEGLQDSAPVEPPAYPEPPARPVSAEDGGKDAFRGSGGEEPPASAAPEKKRPPRWALPAAIAAVVLLVLFLVPGPVIAINSEGVKIGSFYCGPDGVQLGGLLTIDGSGIHLGRSRIAQTTDSGAATLVDETTATFIDEDSYSVSAADITRIRVDWIAGEVYVVPIDGAYITFSESAGEALDERSRLSYAVDGGELEIQWSKSGQRGFDGAKYLYLELPESLLGLLEELEVDVTSADVTITDVEVGRLSLDSTSGDCYVSGTFGSVEADTTSGAVMLEGDCQELRFDSTSGNLWFMNRGPVHYVEADTVSGDVQLELALDGFTLLYETVSGTLYADSYDLMQRKDSNYYTWGSEECQIEVDTVSADLWLH